jgi:hypothetical protein
MRARRVRVGTFAIPFAVNIATLSAMAVASNANNLAQDPTIIREAVTRR